MGREPLPPARQGSFGAGLWRARALGDNKRGLQEGRHEMRGPYEDILRPVGNLIFDRSCPLGEEYIQKGLAIQGIIFIQQIYGVPSRR